MRKRTFVAAAFVILVTAALGPLPAPALAQVDNDMPCWMYDPVGEDCTNTGGGGGCQDCAVMYNAATGDSFCKCGTVNPGGYRTCSVQPRDPICESCKTTDKCPG